jgi:hypothetical protein
VNNPCRGCHVRFDFREFRRAPCAASAVRCSYARSGRHFSRLSDQKSVRKTGNQLICGKPEMKCFQRPATLKFVVQKAGLPNEKRLPMRRFTTASLQAIHEEAAGRDLCFGQGFPRPQSFCEPASLVTAFLAAANLVIEARTSTPRLSRG